MLNQYRRRYLSRLRTLLIEFYELADQQFEAHMQAKIRLEGFIDAGKATFIVNSVDLDRLIEEVHQSIFMMSRAEREARQGTEPKDVGEWAAYDEPTVFRRED